MDRRRYQSGDRPIPGYTLEKWLGQGAFGEVWHAQGPGVDVAMKIVRDLRRNVGGKELRALRTLRSAGSHSNLISLHGYWCLDATGSEIPLEDVNLSVTITDTVAMVPDSLIIVMDLADCSLIDLLQQHPAGLPPEELLVYMRDAARGIDFLNIDHRIQHCDVKPANIFLKSGSAMVGDFGLAKMVDEIRETTSGETPGYSAPELSSRNGPSSASDQYSLAISYVELRTGKLPYEVETYAAVQHAKASGELYLDELTDAESTVVQRATHVNPKVRFERCSQFVEAMEAAVRGVSVPVPLAIPAVRLPNPDLVDSDIKGTMTIGSFEGGTTEAIRPTLPNSSSDTHPNPRQETHRTKTRRTSWPLVAAGVIGFGASLAFVAFLVNRPSTQEQILGMLARGQYSDARKLLANDYQAETDEFIRSGWRNDLIDKSNSDSSSPDQLAYLLKDIEQFTSFYPDDGAKIRAQLDGDIEAIVGEVPAQIQRALMAMSTDSEQSLKIVETWIQRVEAFSDRSDVARQIWQLKLIRLWSLTRRNDANWDELAYDLELLQADESEQDDEQEQSLIRVLSLIARIENLQMQKFDDQLASLNASAAAVENSNEGTTSPWFQPSSMWAPQDFERSRLKSLHDASVAVMAEQLSGKYFPPKLYRPFYELLQPQPDKFPALVKSWARLRIASGDMTGALELFEALQTPAAELSDDMALVRLLVAQNLPDFENRMQQATQLPTPIKLAMLNHAVNAALDHVRDSGAGLESDTSKQHLALAARLTEQLGPGDQDRLHERISSIHTEIIQKVRANIVSTITSDIEPNWQQLLLDCDVAQVDDSSDAILAHVRLECQLETDVEDLSSLPASPLSDSDQAYGEYIRLLVAARADQVADEDIESLATTATTDSIIGTSYRRRRIGQLLARSASKLARQNAKPFSAPFNEEEASTAKRRFDQARVLGWPLTPEEATIEALAEWEAGDPSRATELTRKIATLDEESTYGDYLIWSLGRRAAKSNDEDVVRLVAAPFARLVLSLPAEADMQSFEEDFLVPGARLFSLLPSKRAKSADDEVTFARLCMLRSDFDRANSLLNDIHAPADIVAIANSDLKAIAACRSRNLQSLKQALSANNLPERVQDRLRADTMESALRGLQDGTEQTDAVAFVKQLALVRDVAKDMFASAKRQDFERRTDSLVDKHRAALRLDLIKRATIAQPDFDTLLQLCRLARVNDTDDAHLRLILAESEWEMGAKQSLPLAQSDGSRTQTDEFPWSLYREYLQQMITSENQPSLQSQSLDSIRRIANATNSGLLGMHRQRRLGQALVEHAISLATPISKEIPRWQRVTTGPFGYAAPQAFKLFDQSQTLGYELTEEEKAYRAATLWAIGTKEAAANATAVLLDSDTLPSVADYSVYSLGRYVAFDLAEPERKAWSKITLPFALVVGSVDTDGVTPTQFFEEFVKPGLELAALVSPDQLDDEARLAIAHMLSLGGDLIHDNPDANWRQKGRELFQLQRDVFETAIHFRDDMATLYYGRGVARFLLQDTDGALADAKRAVQIDQQLAKAHFLLARTKTVIARTLATKKRAAAFESVLASYADAYQLRPADNPTFERLVREGRSQANLEFANYHYSDSVNLDDDTIKRIVSHLDSAREDTETVIAALDAGSPHLSVQHQRLGNIFEDYGWLAKLEATKSYEPAIKQFELAIEHAPSDKSRGNAYLHRGRCYTKMATQLQEIGEAKKLEYLDWAFKSLKEAILLDESNAVDWLWLGKAYIAMDAKSLAQDAFLKALRNSEDDDPPWIDRYQAATLAASLIHESSMVEADRMFRLGLHLAGNDQRNAQFCSDEWRKKCDSDSLNSFERIKKLRELFADAAPADSIDNERRVRDYIAEQIIRIPGLVNDKNSIEMLDAAESIAESDRIRALANGEKGVALLSRKQFAQGVTALDAAIQIDKTNEAVPNWYCLKAVMLAKLKKYDAAMDAFIQADKYSQKNGMKLSDNLQAILTAQKETNRYKQRLQSNQ